MTSLLTQYWDPLPSLPQLAGILIFAYGAFKYLEAKRSPLNAIPTIGYSGVLTSYITAFKGIRHSDLLVQEGYRRYPNKAFKVATMSQWMVILSGTKLMDEMRQAPDDVLSLTAAAEESLQTKYTMGRAVLEAPFHAQAIHSLLTRNLGTRFDSIRDEIIESFKDCVPANEEEWTPVVAYETAMRIICRASNRVFVGLPLCRTSEYCSLNERFTTDVAISAKIIRCFPVFLRSLVGQYLTTAPKTRKRAIRYLGPAIDERMRQMKEYGPNWPDKPNDLITWMLDILREEDRNVHNIVLYILSINFGGIFSSSMTFTQALFDLAIHPEYVKELREEIEKVIAEFGWTKTAMERLYKVDSFLKESQRLNSIGILLMKRKTLQDWTLSDGTLIPADTLVTVASDAMNKEEKTFPHPHAFKGFRFSDMRKEEKEPDSQKYQMASLDVNCITFGHGRHACPGRFFAVNIIKAMFAHLLINYDVQLENGSQERPLNLIFEGLVIPDRKAKVMFRKRTT